ncbi:MAG: bacterioferritin [Pseudomonadota bacterium]
MKGNPKVIEYLNKALKLELTAVNQYFLHARILKDWGFNALAKVEYEESIDEMKHADRLIERILFLEGLPNVQDLDRVYIGETVKEILECDLKVEERAHPLYIEASKFFEDSRDFVSRDLMVDILSSEEEHIDFLETQLGLIKRIGEQRYMQSQMGEHEHD